MHSIPSLRNSAAYLALGRKRRNASPFLFCALRKCGPSGWHARIVEVKEKIIFCSECSGITETDPCAICTDASRDRSLICVVEDPSDVFLIERTAAYKGLYHVLMGALSPLDGIGPEQLKIDALVKRVAEGDVREIICATNPNLEGDATVLYLAKLMKPRGCASPAWRMVCLWVGIWNIRTR